MIIRRTKLWVPLAALFIAINGGGAIYAAMRGEMSHAGIHVVLALAGIVVVWRLARVAAERRLASGDTAGTSDGVTASERELASRLTQLEQSIDAVAIEIERVGDGQRVMTERYAERRDMPPPTG
jgi:PDZ domain-containing secreted protein